MLLKLSAFSEVPWPDCVIKSSSPKLLSVRWYVNTACSISVTLELPYQGLVVKIPYSNVAIATTAETNFGIWADGQCVTGRSTWCHLCLDARGWWSKIPDRDCAGLSSNNKCTSIRQKFYWSDVIISLQTVKLGDWCFTARLAYVPHFDTTFPSSVNILCWVAHRDCAHNIPMGKCVDFASMAWNSWAHECICWEWYRPCLSFTIDMKWVSPEK